MYVTTAPLAAPIRQRRCSSIRPTEAAHIPISISLDIPGFFKLTPMADSTRSTRWIASRVRSPKHVLGARQTQAV
jgi:hypothetical protein